MESAKSIIELKNQRRVCRSIKPFTDAKNKNWLLCSDSMYAHTNMDGKFKITS